MRTGRLKTSNGKLVGKQIFLLALPYILTFAAIACFCFCGGLWLRGAIENSPLAALFNAPELQNMEETEIDNIIFNTFPKFSTSTANTTTTNILIANSHNFGFNPVFIK